MCIFITTKNKEMNDQNKEESPIDGMFPEGEERWIKVKYKDSKKAQNHIVSLYRDQSLMEELGIEVTAIGIRDEYTPQTSAMTDIKLDIANQIHLLMQSGTIDPRALPEIIETVNSCINYRIEEIKSKTIETGSPQ